MKITARFGDRRLPRAMRLAAAAAQVPQEVIEKLGLDLMERIRDEMKSSPPPKLEKVTQVRKFKIGSPTPTRSWSESGDMIKNGLRYFATPARGAFTLTVKFRDARHKGRANSKKTYNEIASILENGSVKKNLLPRPVMATVDAELSAQGENHPIIKAYLEDIMVRISSKLTT